MKNTEINALVREAFPMDEQIAALLRGALHDLYHGPNRGDDFPGYTTAIKALRKWADETLCDVWIDTDAGYLLTSEPESWTDEETGETYDPIFGAYLALDKRDVERRIFGALVTDGGL